MPAEFQLHSSQHLHLGAQSYRYLLSEPLGYQPADGWPMVVFLHGRGEIGGDISHLEDFGPLRYQQRHQLAAFTLTPHVPEGRMGWELDELESLLDKLMARHPINPKRVYLTGLSMGGFGALNWALRSPQRFAALAPIAGGDPNLLAPWSMQLDARPICATLYKRLNQLPIYLAHGLLDDVVPAKFSQELFDTLGQLPREATLNYIQYPLIAHPSWEPVYDSPAFWAWLLEQQQSSVADSEPVVAEMHEYQGRYGSEDDFVTIHQGGRLELHCQDQEGQMMELPLAAMGEDMFSCSIGVLRFIREQGELKQLVLARLALLDKLD